MYIKYFLPPFFHLLKGGAKQLIMIPNFQIYFQTFKYDSKSSQSLVVWLFASLNAFLKVDLVNIHVRQHMASAAHLIQSQLIQYFALGRLFTKFRGQINDFIGMKPLC